MLNLRDRLYTIRRARQKADSEMEELERRNAQNDFRERVWDEHKKRAGYRCDGLSQNEHEDWVRIHEFSDGMTVGLFDIIREGIGKKIIAPGQHVLDMGSGDGAAVFLWAYMGFNATGIELHESLKDISKQNLDKCKDLISGVNINFFHGSYYPAEYLKLRDSNKSIANQLEASIMNREFSNAIDGNDYSWKKYNNVFHPVSRQNSSIDSEVGEIDQTVVQDVYTRNALDLKKIDVFYAYVWEIQAPSVAEIFKLYARDDAVLCMIGTCPDDTLRKLHLKRMGEGLVGIYIRKK